MDKVSVRVLVIANLCIAATAVIGLAITFAVSDPPTLMVAVFAIVLVSSVFQATVLTLRNRRR